MNSFNQQHGDPRLTHHHANMPSDGVIEGSTATHSTASTFSALQGPLPQATPSCRWEGSASLCQLLAMGRGCFTETQLPSFPSLQLPQETADFLKIDGVHFLPLCTQSISSATTSNVHINYYHNASTSVCAALPGESVPAVTCILLPSRPCPWLRFPELLHAQQQSWDSPRGGEAAGRVCTQILSDPGSEVHLVHGFLLPSSLCPIEQQHPKTVWSPHAECPQL